LTTLNEDLETYAKRGIRHQLVLVSHVVQHIASQHRATFFDALRGVLAADGIVLVTYPCTLLDVERYLLTFDGGGGGWSKEVDQATFDGVIAGEEQTTDSASLPVWHAGSSHVPALMARAGLAVFEVAAYRRFEYSLMAEGRPEIVQAADVAAIARVGV
jgi:hypothetical protein